MFVKTSLIALGLSAGMTETYALSQKPTSSSSPQDASTSIQATKTKVIDIKTPKGLNAWFVENQDIPVLSVSICFRNAGSKSDPAEKIGLSNFLSGILNEGCGDYDSAAFKKHLLEHNINLSIDSSYDHFIIAFRVPQNSIKEAFRIVKLMLTQPGFAPDAMERIKQQLLTILSQSLHSENAVAGDLMNQRAFAGHPYGRSIQQNLAALPTLTAVDLRKFMTDHFTRDQLTLTAAGAVSQQELVDLLDETLKDLPEKALSENITNVELISPGNVFVQEMDVPQSAILFYQPGIQRHDPDFYAAMVLMKILSDGAFDSRLWHEVREKRGLAYDVNGSLYWNDHSAYIIGSTATQNNSVEQVIQIIRTQWEKIKKEGITPEEVTFTKEKMMGAYPLAFGSTYKIVALLRFYQLDKLAPDFINERNKMIQKITLEDVNRVAKKLLMPEKLSFIVVGKPEGFKAGEAQ